MKFPLTGLSDIYHLTAHQGFKENLQNSNLRVKL